MSYRRPIRKNEINPRLVLFREKNATIDNEKFTTMLEGRHIPPDLTEATEGDEAHTSINKFRRGAKIGMRVVHEI